MTWKVVTADPNRAPFWELSVGETFVHDLVDLNYARNSIYCKFSGESEETKKRTLLVKFDTRNIEPENNRTFYTDNHATCFRVVLAWIEETDAVPSSTPFRITVDEPVRNRIYVAQAPRYHTGTEFVD